MSVSANQGPLISFGQIPQIPGGPAPDYNPSLGPSMAYASWGLMDPRLGQSYQPGDRTGNSCTGWMVGTSAALDGAPSVNSAVNIAAAQLPVAGTAMTLVAATGGGVTVGISVLNSVTGVATAATNLGLDVATSATNGNYGKVLFGPFGAIKIWDPANLTARNVVITTIGDETGATFTIRGFDIYNWPMTETITGVSGAVANGKKAWKYITSITPAGTLSGSNVSVGTGLVFGLPFRADNVGQAYQIFNSTLAAMTTFVAAVTTTATATSGDVRGTFTLTAPSTAKQLAIYQFPSVANLALGYVGITGVTQF